MHEAQLLEHISLNPKVMVGKPVIQGTRLTVEQVLGLLARGATIPEILQEYEGLGGRGYPGLPSFRNKGPGGYVFRAVDGGARLGALFRRRVRRPHPGKVVAPTGF